MRITHITPLFYPHVGGIEKHLAALNAELSKNRHAVTVITQKHDPSLESTEIHKNETVIRIDSLVDLSDPFYKVLYKLNIWKGLYSKLSHLRAADVIHIHDVFWWLIPFLPFLNRKKIFITFHGYEGSEAPKFTQVFWHRIAAWYCSGNICVGDFHKKWYGVIPTVVTYGAVSDSQKSLDKIIFSKVLKIIYIGRLSTDSGIRAYLEAVAVLKNNGLLVHLDVFGSGEYMQYCKEYSKSHHLSVDFHGAINDAARVLPHYHIAFVSRYLAILESLQVGLPVIAHYNNDIKYDYLALAPFAQWISIAHSADEIVASVKKTLQSESYHQPLAAKSWITNQTWQKMAGIYFSLWQSHR